MIDKKLHITIAGFYTVFALIVALITSVIIGISAGVVILIWFSILFIFIIMHGGYIAWVIFKQSEDILIDVEDQSQHMRNEVGHINSALQSFTDVIDGLISQQSSIEKKIDDINKPLFVKEPDSFDEDGPQTQNEHDLFQQEEAAKHTIQKNIEAWENVPLEDQPPPPPPIQYTADPAQTPQAQALPGFLSEGAPPPLKNQEIKPPPLPQISEEEFTAPPPINTPPQNKPLENEEFADVTSMINPVQREEMAAPQAQTQEEEFEAPTTHRQKVDTGTTQQETALEEAFLSNAPKDQGSVLPQNIPQAQNTPASPQMNFMSEIDNQKNTSIPPLGALITKTSHAKQQDSFPEKTGFEESDSLPSLEQLLMKNDHPIPSPANSKKEAEPVQNEPDEEVDPSPDKPNIDIKVKETSHVPEPSPLPESPSASSSENIDDAFLALQNELKNTPSPEKEIEPVAPLKPSKNNQDSLSIDFSSDPLPNPTQTVQEAIENNYFNVAFTPIVDALNQNTALYEAAHYLKDNNNICYPDQAYLMHAQADGVDVLIDRMLITRCVMILKSDHPMFAQSNLIINTSLKALTDDNFYHELIEILKEKPEIGKKIIFSFAHNQFAHMTNARTATLKELTHYGVSYGVHQIDKNLPALQNFIDIGLYYIRASLDVIENGLMIDRQKYHNQDFKQLCNQFGIITIVDSIHDENTVLSAMHIGSDLMMGHHFGRPHHLK